MIYCKYKLMSLCVCVHAHFIVAIEIMILCADFVLEALRLLTTCLTVSLPRFISAPVSLSLPLSPCFFPFPFPLHAISVRVYMYIRINKGNVFYFYFSIFLAEF